MRLLSKIGNVSFVDRVSLNLEISRTCSVRFQVYFDFE